MSKQAPQGRRLSERERAAAHDAALAAVRDGATYADAARRAGVSRSMVYLWVVAAGLPRRRRQARHSAKERAAAVARVDAGASVAQVARSTGIPAATVASWCRLASVGSQHRLLGATPKLRRRICALRRQGFTVVEVAALVGLSRTRVSAHARAGGVQVRVPQRRVQELRRRILAGESASAIAEAMGVQRHTVYEHRGAMRAAGLLSERR